MSTQRIKIASVFCCLKLSLCYNPENTSSSGRLEDTIFMEDSAVRYNNSDLGSLHHELIQTFITYRPSVKTLKKMDAI